MSETWVIIAISAFLIAEALWIYFRIFQRTSLLTVMVGSIILLVLTVGIPILGLILSVLAFFGIINYELKVRTSQSEYTEAKLTYEGGGIRRGFSPVEAAVILEQPVTSVLVLALVELLDKGLVQVDKDSDGNIIFKLADWIHAQPMNLKPAERSNFRVQESFSRDTILLPYEDVLLELLDQNGSGGIKNLNLDIWTAYLEKNVQQKLEGYDRPQTVEYFLHFISHRLTEIWKTEDQLKSHLAWFLCAYFDDRLKTKKIQEAVGVLSPNWLPVGFTFSEFLDCLTVDFS